MGSNVKYNDGSRVQRFEFRVQRFSQTNPEPGTLNLEPRILKAIIFDLDGVIIDSEALHEEAGRRAMSQYALNAVPVDFDAFKGKTEQDVFGYVVEVNEADHVDVDELIALKQRLYGDLIDRLQPVDGALAFIERLAQAGLTMGLTTSSVPENQQRAFDKFDLYQYFDTVITAADVTHPKPHPEPYLTTAQRLGVDPAYCLVIEDSTHGVDSARQAGCQVAGITTSFSKEALAEAGVEVVVDHFDELAQHLRLEDTP